MTALCDVPSCDRPSFCRGYCRAHYARLLRHGDVRADIPVETKTTGGVGYWACHERVKSQRGPASAHRCADCGAPARDWSYDGFDPAERVDRGRGYRYSLDVAHYRPRCRPCHRLATVAQGRPRGQSASVVDVERAIALYRGGVATTGIARARDEPHGRLYRPPQPRRTHATTRNPMPRSHRDQLRQPEPHRAMNMHPEDPYRLPQLKHERQGTPVHRDPMVCAARPGGPAAKIHSLRIVDLVRWSPC